MKKLFSFFVLVSCSITVALSASASTPVHYWVNPEEDIDLQKDVGYNICSSLESTSPIDPVRPVAEERADASKYPSADSYEAGSIKVSGLPHIQAYKYINEFIDKEVVQPPAGPLQEYFPDLWCAPKDPNKYPGLNLTDYTFDLAKSNLFHQLSSFVPGPRDKEANADPLTVSPPLKHFLKDKLPPIDSRVVIHERSLNERCGKPNDPKSPPRVSCVDSKGIFYITQKAAMDNEIVGYELAKAGIKKDFSEFFKKENSSYETQVLVDGISMFFGLISAAPEDRYQIRKGNLAEDGITSPGFCEKSNDARWNDTEYAQCKKANKKLDDCEFLGVGTAGCEAYVPYRTCKKDYNKGPPQVFDPLPIEVISQTSCWYRADYATFPACMDSNFACVIDARYLKVHECLVGSGWMPQEGSFNGGGGCTYQNSEYRNRYGLSELVSTYHNFAPECTNLYRDLELRDTFASEYCTQHLPKAERECRYKTDCINAPNFEYPVNKKWKVGVAAPTFPGTDSFGEYSLSSLVSIPQNNLVQPMLQTEPDLKQDSARLAGLLLKLDQHIRTDVYLNVLKDKQPALQALLNASNYGSDSAALIKMKENLDRSKYFYMAIRRAMIATQVDVIDTKGVMATSYFLKNLENELDVMAIFLGFSENPEDELYDSKIPEGTAAKYKIYREEYIRLLCDIMKRCVEFGGLQFWLPSDVVLNMGIGDIISPGVLHSFILPPYALMDPEDKITEMLITFKGVDSGNILFESDEFKPYILGFSKRHDFLIPINFEEDANISIKFTTEKGRVETRELGNSKSLTDETIPYFNAPDLSRSIYSSLNIIKANASDPIRFDAGEHNQILDAFLERETGQKADAFTLSSFNFSQISYDLDPFFIFPEEISLTPLKVFFASIWESIISTTKK